MDISQRNDVVQLVRLTQEIERHLVRWKINLDFDSWLEEVPPTAEESAVREIKVFRELRELVAEAKDVARRVAYSPPGFSRAPPRRSRMIRELGEDLFLIGSMLGIYLCSAESRALVMDYAINCRKAVRRARRECQKRLRRSIARMECWLSWHQPIEGFLGISIEERKISRNGVESAFGEKNLPWRIFAALHEAADVGLSREHLIGSVWPEGDGDENKLGVHVTTARKITRKIGVDIVADGKAHWELQLMKCATEAETKTTF